MNDSGSPSEPMVQEETFILLEPVDVRYYDVYAIDENRDGVTDGYLLIEAPMAARRRAMEERAERRVPTFPPRAR